jgi:Fic family protein
MAMTYEPRFAISAVLLSSVEAIASLRERIQGAAVEVPWIPALQKDARSRNVHASTAIEGNPLTLEQVRALEEGRQLAEPSTRSQREVTNYLAGLRYVEKRASKKKLVHEDIFGLHHLLAGDGSGRYRAVPHHRGARRQLRSTTRRRGIRFDV